MDTRIYQAIIVILLFAIGTLLYFYFTKPCPSIDNYFTPQEKLRLRLSVKLFDFATYVISRLHHTLHMRDSNETEHDTLQRYVDSKEYTGIGRKLRIKKWYRLFSHLTAGAQGGPDLSKEDAAEFNRLDDIFLSDDKNNFGRSLSFYNYNHDFRKWDKLKRLWGGEKETQQ
jgi:hypothetical protein